MQSAAGGVPYQPVILGLRCSIAASGMASLQAGRSHPCHGEVWCVVRWARSNQRCVAARWMQQWAFVIHTNRPRETICKTWATGRCTVQSCGKGMDSISTQ
ncbi:hypothetical protein K491DRAFT_256395 [Lophiostoma macrostomum CBS 122681]|uniref:Uncharacterized protein n=1 Tax=Lophiostoma macrostomum CBS 122681 TaxID=1314788 RepID=A0A6A6SME1_9PLEO|nr:hypothetical protein K491DRAFT_256395 [Lophiostoma macrostomum CBS 122681]